MPWNVLDEELELQDPNPDIHMLFHQFQAFFPSDHLEKCEVKWSTRMTLCAGLCSFQPRTGFCSIRLSQPLLKLRPRADLVNTLLHEMIHAYLFLNTNEPRDHNAHGPMFQYHMKRINQLCNSKITIFHTFNEEVAKYKTHVWKCDGVCQTKKPFFGVLKRSMNRAPGPKDYWYARHQQECGGVFRKIAEPEEYTKKRQKQLQAKDSKKRKLADKQKASIENYFKQTTKGKEAKENWIDLTESSGISNKCNNNTQKGKQQRKLHPTLIDLCASSEDED